MVLGTDDPVEVLFVPTINYKSFPLVLSLTRRSFSVITAHKHESAYKQKQENKKLFHLGMSKILLKTQAVKNFVDGQQNS